MDTILKNVQGKYIDFFASHINYVVGVVLQRVNSVQNRDD